MADARWDPRFFSTTRGQIVRLLRRAERTVEELAQILALTDNAVRSHLATLERDGLVEQQGTRRGERRPAHVYRLTASAEQHFARAYEPVLGQLLDVLREGLPPERLSAALREVGRRLAAAHNAPSAADLPARARLGAAVLEELGGLVEVEVSDADEGKEKAGGVVRLSGYGCPLGSLASYHPEVCQLAQTLLAEIIGAPVREHCDRTGERPRCRFDVLRA